MACVLAESRVTVGPPVCVHTMFVIGPAHPATTAPAALPTTAVVSAIAEKASAPVQVGDGPVDGGTGAGAPLPPPPPPQAARTPTRTAANNHDGQRFMRRAPGDCRTIDAGRAWSMSRSL